MSLGAGVGVEAGSGAGLGPFVGAGLSDSHVEPPRLGSVRTLSGLAPAFHLQHGSPSTAPHVCSVPGYFWLQTADQEPALLKSFPKSVYPPPLRPNFLPMFSPFGICVMNLGSAAVRDSVQTATADNVAIFVMECMINGGGCQGYLGKSSMAKLQPDGHNCIDVAVPMVHGSLPQTCSPSWSSRKQIKMASCPCLLP